MAEKVKGYYFDKDGNLRIKEIPSELPILSIKGAVLVKKEEIIPERLTEEEKNERIKVINYYAKKYPHLTIEQIGQLIDDSNLGLGEEFVINKILETYR